MWNRNVNNVYVCLCNKILRCITSHIYYIYILYICILYIYTIYTVYEYHWIYIGHKCHKSGNKTRCPCHRCIRNQGTRRDATSAAAVGIGKSLPLSGRHR